MTVCSKPLDPLVTGAQVGVLLTLVWFVSPLDSKNVWTDRGKFIRWHEALRRAVREHR
ncbi:hypothetical protein [Halobellus ruber]|uniref:Uncharacterized protein n=1 Tax=Halobellus ruber TaxID=2761102 RepID=A0A7J9SM66_9EURY|nr:hypothetical protein [Halobellus ruber]MBB6647808.1 hypothetical protein [Halobellus ruber]